MILIVNYKNIRQILNEKGKFILKIKMVCNASKCLKTKLRTEPKKDVANRSCLCVRRCFGGTGAFGMSPKSTWYYFQQGLANRMNRELVTFLRTYNKEYPDLHPKCLTFVEPKKKISATDKLPKAVTNAVGQVGC